jgi:PKHD-type hydroxylase
MRLKHAYCLAEGYFKPHECARIAARFDNQPQQTAGTVKGTDAEGDRRRSDIRWIADAPENKWIYERVDLCVRAANEQYWHWDMSGREALQYTTYGPGQYYRWHTDASHTPYPARSPWAGKLRKISVTVQLSDPADYDGGDFVLEDSGHSPDRAAERVRPLSEARLRGTVIMFPSHLFHQVTEVTRGLRRSLVGWYLGPPFR